MGEYEQAVFLLSEGERLLVTKKWLFFSSSPNYYEASEAFNRAGNLFKTVKAWQEAGEAFVKAADADVQAGEPEESTRKLTNAASCFKKCAPEKAVDVLQRAIVIYLRGGRFHIAAAQEKEVAEIYENQLHDFGEAMVHYEKAGDRYMAEDSGAAASACMAKAASLAALVGDYEKGVRIFEDLANSSAHDPIRKFSVKDNIFKAGLCHLCGGDFIAARRAIERYSSIDPSFHASRECRLLTEIINALESGDVQAFTDEVAQFDKVGLLDEWKTKLLLKIKRSFNEEPSLT